MATSRIALRYSKSLLDLASQEGIIEDVKKDMDAVAEVCAASKELRNLLNNPIVKAADKQAVLGKVFTSTHKTTQLFIAYMVDKKREGELPLVASHFISSYNEMKGIAKATVVSATALSDDTLVQVRGYVENLIGKKDIELSNEVDSSIIGGIIVKHEDKLLDKSVSRELREIRNQLIYN